jgi:hypothetical protein
MVRRRNRGSLVIALSVILMAGCGKEKRSTPRGGKCQEHEYHDERCASGSGLCVQWGGQQTCMPRCNEIGWCPEGTTPVDWQGYDCFCEPGTYKDLTVRPNP